MTKKPLTLEDHYKPSHDEPFMNDKQKTYFKAKLIEWKEKLIDDQQKENIYTVQEASAHEPDLIDVAWNEENKRIEIRARERDKKLIKKIDTALRKIEENIYGYCEITGEPINLERLIARPIASLSIEEQEKRERQEKLSREH